MAENNPLTKSKEEYEAIIAKIKSDSQVGIDAQYTHAIVIEYLDQISARLDKIEKILESKNI